jgi:Predicted flavoprotein
MTDIPDGVAERLGVVLLVGNPAPDSRTLEVGRELAGRLTDELGGDGFDTIDLAGLAPWVFGADRGDVIAAQKRVAAADILIVATPVYKASYTGLLKAFLDGLGPNALSGTVAVPLVCRRRPRMRWSARCIYARCWSSSAPPCRAGR